MSTAELNIFLEKKKGKYKMLIYMLKLLQPNQQYIILCNKYSYLSDFVGFKKAFKDFSKRYSRNSLVRAARGSTEKSMIIDYNININETAKFS